MGGFAFSLNTCAQNTGFLSQIGNTPSPVGGRVSKEKGPNLVSKPECFFKLLRRLFFISKIIIADGT